jgi:hypothetical protein
MKTGRPKVEAQLRAACAELAAIYANAPVALYVIDGDFRVEKANELAARFAGRPAGEIVGRQPGEIFGCLNALADPEGCGKGPVCSYCLVRAAVMDSMNTGARHEGVETWLSRSLDGSETESCLLISSSPMQFDRVRKVLVCAEDITEQKHAQFALESALAEKTILLKEIHHRVKNNLAVISSLLNMKADVVANPTAKEALLNSQQRVYSMALIHEQLYGNDRLDRIDFAEYATQLVRRLHAAVAAEGGGGRTGTDRLRLATGTHRTGYRTSRAVRSDFERAAHQCFQICLSRPAARPDHSFLPRNHAGDSGTGSGRRWSGHRGGSHG